MTQMVGTGIVGMASRGQHFARLYDRTHHRGYELRAICDRNAELLALWKQSCGENVGCYENVSDLVADPRVDAVLVATDDRNHVEPSLAAMEAGKHVLVEKPLCQSLDDARRIVRGAKRSAGIFMVGFELRYCTLFQEMKRLLDEGRIGPVLLAHGFDNVSVGGPYFFHDGERQRAFYKTLLLQKATHSLDLLNWLVDSRPSRVYGIGGQGHFGRKEPPERRCSDCDRAEQCPHFVRASITMDYGAIRHGRDDCVWSSAMDLDDHSLLAVTYESGAKATFQECHFTPEYTREFWLVGAEGKMYGHYDNEGRFLIRIEYAHSRGRQTEEWRPAAAGGAHGGGDVGLRNEFHRRITEHLPDEDAIDSAYYSTALALCAQESIDTGSPVDILPLSV